MGDFGRWEARVPRGACAWRGTGAALGAMSPTGWRGRGSAYDVPERSVAADLGFT